MKKGSLRRGAATACLYASQACLQASNVMWTLGFFILLAGADGAAERERQGLH